MKKDYEERIIAKGLMPPGPLLLVQKKLATTNAERMRIIVSNREAADELEAFFSQRGMKTEIDRAGDTFHVVADLSRSGKEE